MEVKKIKEQIEKKFYSLGLLASHPFRIHTILFTAIMGFFIISTSFLQGFGFSKSNFVAIFSLGSGVIFTYLLFAILTMINKTEVIIIENSSRNKVLISLISISAFTLLTFVIVSLSSGYEASPIFFAWLAVFYFWILSQAYFISSPINDFSKKVKDQLIKEQGRGNISKLLEFSSFPLLAIVVLILGGSIWFSSSFFAQTSSLADRVFFWRIGVFGLLAGTFAVMLYWGRAFIKTKFESFISLQTYFLFFWIFILYRAIRVLMSFPDAQSSTVIGFFDIFFMLVTLYGAMRSLGGKLERKLNIRSESIPFLMFAFGSVYNLMELWLIVEYQLSVAFLGLYLNLVILSVAVFLLLYTMRAMTRVLIEKGKKHKKD